MNESARHSLFTLPDPLGERWIVHARALLDSFRDRTGAELLVRSDDPQDEAERLFGAPFVVVSHGVEPDPILNYGNAAALDLWQMSPQELIATPSRLTAEPMLRDARERLLAEAARRGFLASYSGVRISARGRRFRIHDATVWNVTGPDERLLGQAATFAHWTTLEADER
ncbi:MAG TPA: MEKHLA domain-containing protein [Methylocystis sp.]|nr:MEKHLA domain-containing protein [Methylocystis sp.]